MNDFSAAIDTELNTVPGGDNGHIVEGYVNCPDSENAAIRVVGWDQQDAGYIDNVPGTRTYPTWAERSTTTPMPRTTTTTSRRSAGGWR